MALIVQTPQELAAFTHPVLVLSVCVRNGQRWDRWSLIGLSPVATTGKTRCPNHSAMCRRLVNRASCAVDVTCASGLKTGLNSRRHHRQLRKSGKQFSMGAEEGNRAPPERSPEAIP